MHETEPVSETLQRRVKGARRLAVVGIGDELIPADRLGMAAAREIEARHLPGVKVFFAGTVPESITGPIRRYRPEHVLFLDAAEMGERPGTIAVSTPGASRQASSRRTSSRSPLSWTMLKGRSGRRLRCSGSSRRAPIRRKTCRRKTGNS